MTSNWPNQSRQIERKGRRRCRRREGLNCLVVKWVSSTLLSDSFHSVFLCFVFFLWMIIVQWPPLPPLATTTTIIHNWPISRHFELVADVSYRIVGRYRLTWSGAQKYPSSSIIGAVSATFADVVSISISVPFVLLCFSAARSDQLTSYYCLFLSVFGAVIIMRTNRGQFQKWRSRRTLDTFLKISSILFQQQQCLLLLLFIRQALF